MKGDVWVNVLGLAGVCGGPKPMLALETLKSSCAEPTPPFTGPAAGMLFLPLS